MVGPIFNGFNYGAVSNRRKPIGVVKKGDIYPGGKETINFSKDELEGYSALAITVRATFYNPSVSNNIRVIWEYSQDGKNYDTNGQAINQSNYYDIAQESIGNISQATILVPTLTDYVRVSIENTGNGDVGIIVWATLMG